MEQAAAERDQRAAMAAVHRYIVRSRLLLWGGLYGGMRSAITLTGSSPRDVVDADAVAARTEAEATAGAAEAARAEERAFANVQVRCYCTLTLVSHAVLIKPSMTILRQYSCQTEGNALTRLRTRRLHVAVELQALGSWSLGSVVAASRVRRRHVVTTAAATWHWCVCARVPVRRWPQTAWPQTAW
jgi:hypothetical protein